MKIVGQIAKDIFTSYGEMLTQSGKFLRDNRKKILDGRLAVRLERSQLSAVYRY